MRVLSNISIKAFIQVYQQTKSSVNKAERKAETRNQNKQVPRPGPNTIWENDKTKENTTYKQRRQEVVIS